MFNINYYQNMYTHLIISGGGVKATSIIGVLEVLYEKNLLDLKGMIGSSAGGLICFLLNIGYTYQEMKEILFSLDFGQYRDIDFSRVLEKWGLDTGLKIMKLIGSVAKQKDISPDITFKELYDKTQQELTLTGSELTKNEAIYFNYHNFPDMKVLDALRITISFPVVFYPIHDQINKKVYVDGAMFNPYPIEYYNDIKEKIGICLHNSHNIDEIKDGEDYLMSMFNSMQERYEKYYLNKYLNDSIIIDIKNVHSMSFGIDNNEKMKMYEKGKEITVKYLETHNK